MLISHKYKFIFIHNPKAGGSAIRKALRPLAEEPDQFWHQGYLPHVDRVVDLAHLELSELQLASLPYYHAFMVVRDPILRFLSALYEHSRQHGRMLGRPEAVADFVDRELTFGNLHYDWKYVHFRPQYRFMWLPDSQPVVPVLILKHDQLRDQWGNLSDTINYAKKAIGNQVVPPFPALPTTRVRPDQSKLRVEDLTKKTLYKLVRVYARDYLDFGYTPPVPIETDGSHSVNIEMIHRDELRRYVDHKYLTAGELAALRKLESHT